MNGQWMIEMYNDLDSSLELESVDCKITLRDLYAKVNFENQP